jgi:alkylation response protein AidB-like acyl-CoA dehydrogenase
MQDLISEDQEELRRLLRRFFEEKSPEVEVRRLMETPDGFDREVWKQMADQMMVQGLAIPEQYGGQGYGAVEQVIALEEMGRVLLCSPYLASAVLGAGLLLASDDEDIKKQYLPAIASGETIATVALCEPSERWDEEGIALKAVRSGKQWLLSGTKSYVLHGGLADLILVVGRTRQGVSVFAVDAEDAEGLQTTPLKTVDRTRKQTKMIFERTPARLVGDQGEGWGPVSTMLDKAAIGLGAEQAGGALRVLDMAVDYAKVRFAFGRPIGSFQGVKHRCADIFVKVECARSAVYYAGKVSDAGDSDEVLVLASLVKAYCSDAFLYAATENIQLHGGIGFTWEHPAHLYYRRAMADKLLLGSPMYHRELVAQRLGV